MAFTLTIVLNYAQTVVRVRERFSPCGRVRFAKRKQTIEKMRALSRGSGKMKRTFVCVAAAALSFRTTVVGAAVCIDEKITYNNRNNACKAFVSKKPRKRCELVINPEKNIRIKNKCRHTCGQCDCIDDPTFFYNKEENNCAWVAKGSDAKTAKKCKKTVRFNGFKNKVKHHCRIICNTCAVPTPQPTPQRSNSPSAGTSEPQPQPTPQPTPHRSNSPSAGANEPQPQPTPQPAPQREKTTGEICSQNSECLSGVCQYGTCYKSDVCKKIKHTYGSAFDKDKIVLVFVGSGFTDLDAWRAQVTTSYSSFDSFEFFDPTNPQFISVYVDELKPSFCNYNCYGIRRLLCCNVATAQTLAEKCFPTGTTHQTIVVHNDSEYGGAGYRYSNMATLSIHASGPLVAVHELGHSLFNLGDEYSYNDSSNSAQNPNCDTSGCSKWSDLIDNGLAGCTIRACNTGPNRPADYFVGERSFMQYLSYPVGEINLRFSCCTFLALTGNAPDYCEKYDSGVFNAGHLLEYCKNDYQGYGAVYPTSDTNTQESTSGKYVYLENAKQLIISKDFEYIGSSSRMDSNLHLRSEMFGDFPHEKLSFFAENGNAVKITIVFSSGERLVQFRKKHVLVHVPFSELESASSESDPLDVKLPLPYLHVVVDGNKGDVIDVIVTDVVFSI